LPPQKVLPREGKSAGGSVLFQSGGIRTDGPKGCVIVRPIKRKPGKKGLIGCQRGNTTPSGETPLELSRGESKKASVGKGRKYWTGFKFPGSYEERKSEEGGTPTIEDRVIDGRQALARRRKALFRFGREKGVNQRGRGRGVPNIKGSDRSKAKDPAIEAPMPHTGEAFASEPGKNDNVTTLEEPSADSQPERYSRRREISDILTKVAVKEHVESRKSLRRPRARQEEEAGGEKRELGQWR